ncbi:MAG TPA: hypothetical protein VFU23_02935 [Gemmatimonadales bacterium]|nr:hypothetical protein [Gemmatimonadales bacterium]
MTDPPLTLEHDAIRVGDRLTITFQRTLRIPDDGRAHPLPPGLGRFPVRRASDYPDRAPEAWLDAFFIPMYRREALWLGFEGAWWKPNAVKVGVGGIDAISGASWTIELRSDPQNYIVVPAQPWLDGINAGSGTVRQFVAMPMGAGYSIEAQLTGEERIGGIQVAVFEPLPGRFPDQAPPEEPGHLDIAWEMEAPSMLGIGAGGTMRQKIYPDAEGLEAWDPDSAVSFVVHLVDVAAFCAITGEPRPATPVDAEAYTAAGFPWFELDDREEKAISAAEQLARVRSIRELEGAPPERGVVVPDAQVSRLRRRGDRAR